MAYTIEGLANPEVRRGLQQKQFDLAMEFYAIEGDTDDTREEHRRISQEMAFNAIDLSLQGLMQNIREKNLAEVALVAPLRGGLGLVTQETKQYLEERLAEAGLEDVAVRLIAQGIKRHPETGMADVYFSSGYEGFDNSRTHAVILDWGTATGLTNVAAAKELKAHGIDFDRITAVSMTLSEEGKQYMEEQCPGMTVEAATRAELNAQKYVYRIAPDSNVGGEARDITPKDWGMKMFGMEVPGDNKQEVILQIARYIRMFRREFEGFADEEHIEQLEQFYLAKYVPLAA